LNDKGNQGGNEYPGIDKIVKNGRRYGDPKVLLIG